VKPDDGAAAQDVAPDSGADPADVFEFPASSVQQRLWFLEQWESEGAVYNQPVVYRLSGALDIEALERSLREIVQRHEVLRTTFANDVGTIVQRVSSRQHLPVPLVDLANRPDREAELRRLLDNEVRQPFDLAAGPLVRARIFRMAPDDHVLSLTFHHVIFDGWSEDVLFRELQGLYEAFRNGRPSPLPELPIQYGDYAVWQSEQLAGPDLDRQLDYWKRQLNGLGVLELPVDRPHPAEQSYRGAERQVCVPPPLVPALMAVSRQEKATLFMVLAAALQVLLHRHSGQSDLAIGIVVSGRNRSELEGMLGCFVNTLVLRADLSGDPTFRQFLGRVRETARAAYAHQDLPFERVVEELPQRNVNRSPLFQVLFNQAPAAKEGVLGDLVVRRTRIDVGIAKFDLSLTLSADLRATGLDGWLEYNTDLFDAGTIDRFFDHYLTLLAGVGATPDARLSQLPLQTDAERQQLLVTWNDTAAEVPERLLHELVEAQAARTPERPAVRVGSVTVSYGELEARATQLAQILRARHIGRGQLVGLCVERGVDMLAALLGILKTGAAYVPLDPSFPEERLRFMADDAGLALLVSTTELARGFSVPRERQFLIDQEAAAIAAARGTPVPVDSATRQPADPAYVIYTSGSTGKPKGVVIPHRAVVNFLASMAREPGLRESDRLVAVTTLSFDIAVLELLLPLTIGAEVILASRDEAADGEALRALLESSHATVMQATPATWRLLLEAGWTGGPDFKALVGGESLPPSLAQQLTERAGELWNLYGPTETTVWSTCWRVRSPESGISIGRPIANTTVYVLDEHRQPCPIGVPGEIYIGGAGLALGYLHRAELTGERFIPDLFSATPGARLYRTGDRGRWLANGDLEHLGRLDFQVKVRGFRIELGEIESTLEAHEAVRQAVVVVRGNSPDETRLVAYLVFSRGHSATDSELRRFLRGSLPEYMLPNIFVELDQLPLTNNGKVNRLALPPPADEQRRDDQDYVAPRSETEKAIAAVWQEVLGVARVSVRDNFFELGGHSLLAAQVVARLARSPGYRLGLRSVVFETLEQLAAGVDVP
jgi:amino acid adenylation domain-containing protein